MPPQTIDNSARVQLPDIQDAPGDDSRADSDVLDPDRLIFEVSANDVAILAQ